jgi:L,D-transpeptidase catalytic domain
LPAFWVAAVSWVGVCVRDDVHILGRGLRLVRGPVEGPFRIPSIVGATLLALCAAIPPNSEALARTSTLRPMTEAPRAPSPILVLVSIQKQRLRAFDASGEVTQSRISSGRSGFDTPTGVFSVLEKSEYHESNIYEGAPMPFMQRLTWSGIAMHAGVVPGYRASHGCIRLPASFAPTLFGMTRVGNRVVVTPNETEPIVFDHPNLFKPLPAETPKSTGLRGTNQTTQVASNDTAPDAMAELPFLRFNPALSEAARDTDAFAPERPRSRAEADRMFMDKVNKLQLALKAAEMQKTKASATAKVAVKDGDEAQDKLTAAKKALEPARAAIEAADKKLADARQAFEDYMAEKPLAAPASKSAAKTVSRGEDREADLEEAILDLRIEADGARADLARREMDVAAIQGIVSGAETARAAALEDVRQNQEQLRNIQADLVETNKQAVRRGKSISVFVSLKTERIYVRLGQDPLFEAPIEVTNPGKRFGTHVMTAMRYGSDPNTFDWRLVSAQLPATVDADDDDDDASKRKKRRYASVPVNEDGSVRMARAALDSIKIPQDIQDTITELARPGASFIISDRELNASENGNGTEFVLLTR